MTTSNLPRFLLCDAGDGADEDRCFVVHTRPRRFVVEMVPGGRGELTMLDKGRVDSPEVLRAVVVACEWFGGEEVEEG